jgi:hypothetical protein
VAGPRRARAVPRSNTASTGPDPEDADPTSLSSSPPPSRTTLPRHHHGHVRPLLARHAHRELALVQAARQSGAAAGAALHRRCSREPQQWQQRRRGTESTAAAASAAARGSGFACAGTGAAGRDDAGARGHAGSAARGESSMQWSRRSWTWREHACCELPDGQCMSGLVQPRSEGFKRLHI